MSSSCSSTSELTSSIVNESFVDSNFTMNMDHSESIDSSVHSNAESSKSFQTHKQSNIEAFPLVPYNMLTDKKPRIGLLFDCLTTGLQFYTSYGQKVGFDVNLGSQKRYNDGTVRLRYAMCSRSGSTKSFEAPSMYENESTSKRKTSSKKKQCPAIMKLKNLRCTPKFYIYVFVEQHSHDLVSEENLHFLRSNRKLDYLEESFIHGVGAFNIGATRAHGLLSNIKGGYDVSGGIAVDFKNFERDVNGKIGAKDAQMVVNILENRKLYVSDFSFEVKTHENHLTGLFWADEASKCNFKEFGDIISFDATYGTNKYSMVFVPFTGIDNHKKSVTFGAGLLANESTESYVWLLREFFKAFDGKQPKMIVTDQDPAMKNAVNIVFPESMHRLCMWHITKKLPDKVSAEIYNHPDFLTTFNGIVWNLQDTPEQFDAKWASMIDAFDLQENSWLTSLFDMRKSWIPAHLRDIPLSGLMRTTSRSESENSAFKSFLKSEKNLVKFIMSFDSAMEKQRHKQKFLDFKSSTTIPKPRTPFSIEAHASEIYTRKVFLIVQKEIYKSAFYCKQQSLSFEEYNEVYIIRDKIKGILQYLRKKRGKDVEDSDEAYDDSIDDLYPDIPYKVVYNSNDDSYICSCMLFAQQGILCRHIFYILNAKEVDEIPLKYISRRWEKDIIAQGVLMKKYSNSHSGGKNDQLIQEAYALLRLSVNKIANDEVELSKFITQLQQLSITVPLKQPSSRGARIENLIGTAVPDVVNIQNPVDIRNKGWASGKRLKSMKEKAIDASKKQQRKCSICNKPNHNARSCTMRDQN